MSVENRHPKVPESGIGHSALDPALAQVLEARLLTCEDRLHQAAAVRRRATRAGATSPMDGSAKVLVVHDFPAARELSIRPCEIRVSTRSAP
jgi:hypothetical protein